MKKYNKNKVILSLCSFSSHKMYNMLCNQAVKLYFSIFILMLRHMNGNIYVALFMLKVDNIAYVSINMMRKKF